MSEFVASRVFSECEFFFSWEYEKISLFFPSLVRHVYIFLPSGCSIWAHSKCSWVDMLGAAINFWICSWWLGGYLLSLPANAPGFSDETISAKFILLSSRVRMNHILEWRKMKERIHKEYREKYLFHWSISCNFITKDMFKIFIYCILISWKAFTSNQSPQIHPSDQRK